MAFRNNNNHNFREGNRVNDYWREASGRDPKERAERMQRDMETYNGRGIEGLGRRRLFGRRTFYTNRSSINSQFILLYIAVGMILAGLTIYAIRFYSRDDAPTTYTITFETDGGTSYEPISYNPEHPLPMLMYTPTKEGYLFMGWYTNETLTTRADAMILNTMHQKDLTFYAKWVPINTTRSISFETNGGSSMSPLTFSVGDSLRLNIPTKDDMHFLGWHKDSTFNQHITNVDETSETLYALWGRYPMATIGEVGKTYYVPKPGGYTSGIAIGGGFQIGRYEVTYGLWQEVIFWASTHGYTFTSPGRPGNVGNIGAYPTGYEDDPVTTITWLDAIVWLNAFSEYEGLDPVYYYFNDILKTTNVNQLAQVRVTNHSGYRLPNMMEWMMAARLTAYTSNREHTTLFAGYYWVTEDYLVGQVLQGQTAKNEVGWFPLHSNNYTHPVGQKLPNQWGIYDMTGNVSEWVQDFVEQDTVQKWAFGGSYEELTYPTVPMPYDYDTALSTIGFRIARGPISPYAYYLTLD